MGLSLGRLSEAAAKVESLEQQMLDGDSIHSLDPGLVEPSFVQDRLARTSDADFRRLVDSISAAGQQVPILVRPHPELPGRYQVAYGHRRLDACLKLKQSVKAVVRAMTDAELVVAQGKENAERRNLSFIERAQFAAHLEQRGFERPVIQAALSGTSRGTNSIAFSCSECTHRDNHCNRTIATRWPTALDGVGDPTWCLRWS